MKTCRESRTASPNTLNVRLVSVVLMALITGCSTLKITTDIESDHDRWTYRTFNWASPCTEVQTPLYYQHLIDLSVKSAATAEMISKGYLQATERPELLLHYQVIVDEKAITPSEAYAFADDPYWLDIPGRPSQYREGTLIVDLTDARAGHLVWRAWAVAPVNEQYTPEKIKQRINDAVSKMFERFPANKHMAATTVKK